MFLRSCATKCHQPVVLWGTYESAASPASGALALRANKTDWAGLAQEAPRSPKTASRQEACERALKPNLPGGRLGSTGPPQGRPLCARPGIALDMANPIRAACPQVARRSSSRRMLVFEGGLGYLWGAAWPSPTGYQRIQGARARSKQVEAGQTSRS